jgi:hypothetical protein
MAVGADTVDAAGRFEVTSGEEAAGRVDAAGGAEVEVTVGVGCREGDAVTPGSVAADDGETLTGKVPLHPLNSRKDTSNKILTNTMVNTFIGSPSKMARSGKTKPPGLWLNYILPDGGGQAGLYSHRSIPLTSLASLRYMI